jgi:hypothetical protein
MLIVKFQKCDSLEMEQKEMENCLSEIKEEQYVLLQEKRSLNENYELIKVKINERMYKK